MGGWATAAINHVAWAPAGVVGRAAAAAVVAVEAGADDDDEARLLLEQAANAAPARPQAAMIT
jgi:hypothetical protein